MVALKCTGCRRPIATPLRQPSLRYLCEGLIGSANAWKDVEQLQLLVRRVEVEQRDDEDDRRTRQPMILREQQRSTYTTCVVVAPGVPPAPPARQSVSNTHKSVSAPSP